jgi:hypothetical protein
LNDEKSVATAGEFVKRNLEMPDKKSSGIELATGG